ncbi:MAG: hypothetical protein K2Q12_04925 [Rickettsiales bacterium]|nr:hypothetical protein [Rickettsiales bacterium]
MIHFIEADEDVLPDYSELDDNDGLKSLFDEECISFDQMRHALDQPFESDAIPDVDSPEIIARNLEAVSHVFHY